jgi:hypothetical protein
MLELAYTCQIVHEFVVPLNVHLSTKKVYKLHM